MHRTLPALTLLLALGFALSAQPPKLTAAPMTTTCTEAPFGTMPDGSKITCYTLTNAKGMKAKCINYGAIVTELHAPDKGGKMADVVLGFDKLEDYLKGHPYFGANAGRCANRIANAKFTLDGTAYTITKSDDGAHTLHGGKEGFDKKVWAGEIVKGEMGDSIRFTLTSKDGDQGYPGTLKASVTYSLTEDNGLMVSYEATTDKPTVCNLAHHSYFNLAGAGMGDILGHEVEILAKSYTPTDETLIPTGKIAPVAGTCFDFTKPKPIGTDLKAAGGTPIGFDLNYVLDKGITSTPSLLARVMEPKSGRTLEVSSTEPGLQFYSGNFLDGTNTGKGGAVYKQYNGFCMEPQKFPDSINKPEWKEKSNVVLRPGETYRQTSVFKFGVK